MESETSYLVITLITGSLVNRKERSVFCHCDSADFDTR